MPTPSIAILGVYRPDTPTRVYKQQWRVTGSDERTKAHFKDLVLIEAVVEQIDDRFKMVELGQTYTRGDYKDHFQCAYDGAFALIGWENRYRKEHELCKRCWSPALRVLPTLLRCESPASVELWTGPMPVCRACSAAAKASGAVPSVHMRKAWPEKVNAYLATIEADSRVETVFLNIAPNSVPADSKHP